PISPVPSFLFPWVPLFPLVRLLEQFLHCLIERLAAKVLVADDAVAVENVHGRERPDVPLLADRPFLAPVPPAAPGDLAMLDALLQGRTLFVGHHRERGERLAFEALDQSALARVHCLARPA